MKIQKDDYICVFYKQGRAFTMFPLKNEYEGKTTYSLYSTEFAQIRYLPDSTDKIVQDYAEVLKCIKNYPGNLSDCDEVFITKLQDHLNLKPTSTLN